MHDYALLLHGAASTCEFMARTFPAAMLGVHTMLAPQQIGDEEHYREALHQLVNRLGVPQVMCGVSLGAHIAVDLALRVRPARLLLCLPAALDSAPATGRDDRTETGAAAPVMTDSDIDVIRARMAHADGDWIAHEVARAWDLLSARQVRTGLAAGARSRGPAVEALRRLDLPCTILGWPDDPLHPIAVAQQWASQIPGARLVVMDRAEVEGDPFAIARAISGSQ